MRIEITMVRLGMAVCLASTATAQDVREMESKEWTQRDAAFRNVLAKSPPGERADLIMRLLRQESAVIETALRNGTSVSALYGEEYSEYYAAVLEACVDICGREALLNHVLSTAAPGNRAQRDAVQLLGVVRNRDFTPSQRSRIDSALVQAATAKHSFMVRSAAARALATALSDERTAPRGSLRARMHASLRRAATDPYDVVRVNAVRALAELADRSDLALLESIAARDTTSWVSGGRRIYPVRAEAERGVRRIRARTGGS